MAKIIYGVSGEGSGHSSRARLITEYLIGKGHEVKIVSYDRGYRNLSGDFDVLEIVGLTIVSEDNEVSKLKTIAANLTKLPEGTRAFNSLRGLFKQFSPECVISDFEPTTAYLANHYKLPLISLDNQHRMRYMDYVCPDELKQEAFVTETVIRAMVPKPWVSLITTFHFGPLKNSHSFLFPPILRKNILALGTTEQDHILVYVTSGFDSLIDCLSSFDREQFIVYGSEHTGQRNNILFKEFSADGFPRDLAACKAVIATAGFTLISEALYLNKPYLAFPMQGQFEQQLNAHMLEKKGYGVRGGKVDEKTIAAFLYQLPKYKTTLSQYPRDANHQIQQKLDELLDDNLKHLLAFKPQ